MNEVFICASDKQKEQFKSLIEDLNDLYLVKNLNSKNSKNESVIIVLGGDGSLNYLVNLLDSISNQKILYFPAGTANDFAKSLKINRSAINVNIIRDIIENAPLIDVPIMCCNDKRFINVATGGALALITSSGEDILKKLTGKLIYYVGALEEILSPNNYEITYQFEGESEVSITTNGFIISQGIFAGGGVKITPHICSSFKEKFNFLTLASKDLTSSLGDIIKLQKEDDVCELDGSKIITKDLCSLTLRSNRELPLKIDGEEYSSKILEFSKIKNTLQFYQY